jgi:two-component system chemotaxis sensor kinase CheA
VETLNGAEMIRLRERLLPVVSMRRVLRAADEGEMQGYVVVLEAAGRKIGLVVDDVLDTEEIVVKPLSAQLRPIPVYSGATILGDGAVIMILDPNGVASEIAHTEEESAASESAADARAADPNRQRLLLVRAGGTEPKAVPVALITRLEEFNVADIERVDGRNVVQYRGRLLSIAHAGGDFPAEGRIPVLVFTEDDRSAGVAVDAILDVVEESVELQLGSDRPGIVGSAILQGRATEMLDMGWYMERAWMGGSPRRAAASRKAVLLVEADAFARRMMAPLLAAAGYDVTVAADLREARDAAEMGAEYDAVVGDPAALAELGAAGCWPDVPRLAISEDEGAGAAFAGLAGVTRPGDRGGLIAALDRASQARAA